MAQVKLVQEKRHSKNGTGKNGTNEKTGKFHIFVENTEFFKEFIQIFYETIEYILDDI